MRYLGGKSRLAKTIVGNLPIPVGRYVEPFMGGGATMVEAARRFPDVPIVGSDLHTGLIDMWRAGVDGTFTPPETVSTEQYYKLKAGDPSPLRTYVSFGCSFGGKEWGGFARDATGVRDLSRESYNRVTAEIAALANHPSVTLENCSYEELTILPRDVVYCDPPYRGTTGYKTGSFDHEAFDLWAEKAVLSGAQVYVSEFSAPDHWEVMWERPRKTSVGGLDKVEKLFKVVPKA